MAISVVMPALEMAQETGKLLAWLKKEGESVRKGEMLLEVETDKAVVEIEAAGDGILAGVTAQPGDVIAVGRTIAWLVQPGESAPAGEAAAPAARRTDGRTPSATPAGGVPVQARGGAVRISPKARRLAQERGVDLATIAGSGPGGEILADDILAAAAASEAPRPAGPRQAPAASAGPASGGGQAALDTIGRLMAARTTESWTTVPHFFVTREVDASPLQAARDTANRGAAAGGARVTYTDLLVAAVARTLARHPRLNASWTGDGVALHADINVALAVAVENAVVTVVIPRADTAGLADLARRRVELADRARAGRLQPDDIARGTFTISNLGMFGVDAFTAIIVPPQAAILAVGAVADRVIALDGVPAVRPMMTMTLSCDHRVVDGARAAEFLRDVAGELART